MRRSGFFGRCEQNLASKEANLLDDALSAYWNNNEVSSRTNTLAWWYIQRNKAKVAGRASTHLILLYASIRSRSGYVSVLSMVSAFSAYHGNARNIVESINRNGGNLSRANLVNEITGTLITGDDSFLETPSMLELFKNRNDGCGCRK